MKHPYGIYPSKMASRNPVTSTFVKKCLFCGKDGSPTVKSRENSEACAAQRRAILIWRSSCASALVDTIGIQSDTVDKAYAYILQFASYCDSCLEKTRNIEFFQRFIKLSEKKILDSLERIFKNLRAIPHITEMEPETITPDRIEGPDQVSPSSLSYKQVVKLIYLSKLNFTE